MVCKLCKSHEYIKRNGSVRDDSSLDILECLNCGLVYLSEFKHIDKNYYENSDMHKKFDFYKWRNETKIDDKRRYTFIENLIINKTILDFGSGNGGFLSYTKSITKYNCGIELEKAIKPFYKKENIALFSNLQEVDKKFDIITAFHVIEHLENPKDILEDMKRILKDDGKIIIEVPNANDILLTVYKNEAFSNFTYWSCHLFLYTQYTLSLLAKQAGLKVDFIKHIQRYPLSNHLYWLSNNKPGGHNQWGNFIDSTTLTDAYEEQLASLGATDTIIAQFSKE